MTAPKDKSNPSHAEVRVFYNQAYYTDEKKGALPWHLRRIADRLGPVDGLEVLDIACGTGAWLGELAMRGAQPAGIDISSRAIEHCRQRLARAEIVEGIAEDLPFEDARFDLVTCLGSLEHFLDQPKALQEMRRVARPGATVLVLVPNAGFLTRRLGLYGGTGQVAIRETVRSIGDWAGMLEDAGLEVSERWRDLHPLSLHWIGHGRALSWPLRAAQALALTVWPISWQYQVYFRCLRRHQ
jgi:SAM-dependent methyltransferase